MKRIVQTLLKYGGNYIREYTSLEFVDRHAVVGVHASVIMGIASVVLSGIGIWISLWIFEQGMTIQQTAESIQRAQRIEENNERVKEAVRRAGEAFDLNRFERR